MEIEPGRNPKGREREDGARRTEALLEREDEPRGGRWREEG